MCTKHLLAHLAPACSSEDILEELARSNVLQRRGSDDYAHWVCVMHQLRASVDDQPEIVPVDQVDRESAAGWPTPFLFSFFASHAPAGVESAARVRFDAVSSMRAGHVSAEHQPRDGAISGG